ncbi:MAG: tetratricopeptide repeat protein, partial [Planctomycetota bacterium]
GVDLNSKNPQKTETISSESPSKQKKSSTLNIDQELSYQHKYLRQGKLSQGLEYYKKLAEDAPQDPVALMLCGNFLLYIPKESAQWDEGKEYLETALDLDPKMPYIHAALGFYHELKTDYAKAELSYQKALQQNPIFARAKLGLARIAHFRRNLEEAILITEEVLKKNSKEPMAYLMLAKIYSETSLSKALKILQKGAQEVPEEPDLYKALGKIALDNNQSEEGIQYFQTYIKLAPDAVDVPDIQKFIEYYQKQVQREQERMNLLLSELTNFGIPYENRRKAAKTLLELPAWNEKVSQAAFKGLKEDEDYGVRIYCVRGLSKNQPSSAVIDLFLQKLKEDHHHQVRTTIAKALGDLHIKKAVPIIISILEEEDSYFMDVANQTLNTLTGEKNPYEATENSEKQQENLKKAQEFWKTWKQEHSDWIKANA